MIHEESVSLLNLFHNWLCVKVGVACGNDLSKVALAILDELAHSEIDQVRQVKYLLVIDVFHCAYLFLWQIWKVDVEQQMSSLTIQVIFIYYFGCYVRSCYVERAKYKEGGKEMTDRGNVNYFRENKPNSNSKQSGSCELGDTLAWNVANVVSLCKLHIDTSSWGSWEQETDVLPNIGERSKSQEMLRELESEDLNINRDVKS